MKFYSLLTSFIFIFCFNSSAQRVCGSADYAKANAVLSRENYTAASNAASRDTLANEVITIPVVIHVLYNNAAQNISDAQIYSQIKALNEDFRRLNADAVNTPAPFKKFAADARIMFCVAQINAAGKPASGIVRKYTSKSSFMIDDAMKFSSMGGDDGWDSKKYLNIWVCNLAGQSLGYASFPGAQPAKDGVVISCNAFGTVGNLRPEFNKGRSATHEIGHWLGLKHIWGDDKCGNDGIDDTPQQAGNNYNCPSFPRMSSCSPDANGDMFMNYMDYTNDACMNMFTAGQVSKMRSLFALNGSKNTFLMNANLCDSSALESGGALPVSNNNPEIPVNTPSEEKLVADVRIYPNPVNQFINLVAENGYELVGKTITLYNNMGAVLMQKTITAVNDKINVNSISKGMYFLSIGKGTERKVLKVIKI